MDLIERQGSDPSVRHPWESVRAEFFVDLVRSLGDVPHARVLDVGAGDAFFAAHLAGATGNSRVTCWDTNYSPENVARLSVSRGDSLCFTDRQPTDRFDLILMLDVIEHVEDDLGFLRGIIDQNLSPGGRVLVSVPAYQWLFGPHDVAFRHFRRYSPSEMRDLLAKARLRIDRSGGLFTTLLVARAVQRALERIADHGRSRAGTRATGIGEWKGGRIVTGAITTLLRADARVGRAFSDRGVPIGLSFWALCRAED